MIVKTIEWENLLGEKESGQFYFSISKGELVKMQMSAIDQRTESFTDKLEKIGRYLQGKALIEVIDEVIDTSYGVRSTDGKNFIKTPQDLAFFKSTDAYSELVVELCTNSELCAEFINGVVPAKLREQANAEVAKAKTAQELREQSLAAKGGFNQKQEASSVKQMPDLPVVIEQTAEPVFEPQPDVSVQTPSPAPQLSGYSREQLEAMVAAQNANTQG